MMMLVVTMNGYSQDPSFSQFFSSPLNINPSLTANINGKWRVIGNFRDQWIGPASPYATATISYDTKIAKNYIPEDNVFGIGGMLMFDYAFKGIVKSTYGSLNVSYNVKIGEDVGDHRLGAGVGIILGGKNIDFHRLDFPEQFTGSGFNRNLPTGEAALSNMKPYISSSAGLVYTYQNPTHNLDIGFGAFHLNKPKQTVIDDPNQYLAQRFVGHANFETILNNGLAFMSNAIYQNQKKASYWSVGAALGFFLNEGTEDMIFNVGGWYWSKNAIIPYVGLKVNRMQFGITYDITISKLSEAEQKPKTFEISFIIRGDDKPDGVMWCPWK